MHVGPIATLTDARVGTGPGALASTLRSPVGALVGRAPEVPLYTFLLLSACASLFAPKDGATSDTTPTETDADDTRDDEDDEPIEASLVTILTDEIDMVEGTELEIPSNATLLRVDSCRDDSDEGTVCTTYAGTYYLYEDTFVLSPSGWDDEYARVTWLKVKDAQ